MNPLKQLNWRCIESKVIHFIHMQAFLTLISLPILVSWGLPLSILSPLGNIIFSVPLAIFLLLSSLIFFCEILYVPNGLLIYCLDAFTTLWRWSISGEYRNIFIGFSCPSMIVLSVIPVIACVIICFRVTHERKKSSLLLCVLLFLVCIGLKVKDRYHAPLINIARSERSNIVLARYGTEYVFIDPGYLGTTISASTWVTYTLVPEIIKQTGTLTIDHLIVLQLNNMTLEALITLCKNITVKKLYLPWWTGKFKGKGWYNYRNLHTVLYKNKGEIVPLKDKKIIIYDNNQQLLLIKPTGKIIPYKNITYPAFCVDGTIDNGSFTIYAAKHIKMKRIS